MRMHSLVKLDDVIYWEKRGVDDIGEAVFEDPIIIKGRWDIVNTDVQREETNVTQVSSNGFFPDRVLVLDSFVMLGGAAVLAGLSEAQKADPRLNRDARSIKSQSVIFEFRWEQKNVEPGYQSEHMTVECQL